MSPSSWDSTRGSREALATAADDRSTFDAAEEFLAAVLHAYRKHLAPAGTKLKKIRVGGIKRGM